MQYRREDGHNTTGWIETYTGRMVTPVNPDPETFCVTDIAHALANKCRYSGHTLRFYTVAEHSWLMAQHALESNDYEVARWALLHDAVEAYLPDVARPLKPFIANWKELEASVESAIKTHFEEYPNAAVEGMVHSLDTRILLTEAVQLLPSQGRRWEIDADPLPIRLRCWQPSIARINFLDLFGELFPWYDEPPLRRHFDAASPHPCECEEQSPTA